MKVLLHFTFGPVQSFVAEARRTRDLYAGSFLISHLALKAMKEVREHSGEIILPDYARLEELANDPNLKHAIAPNHFTAKFSDEMKAAEAGRSAAASLQKEWRRIAEVVWGRYLQQVAEHGFGARAIWERQILNFWEVAWVVSADGEMNLLDRRKNWRTPPPTVEPGDHCTLMGQWQELSGFVRSKQRDDQNRFWGAVRGVVRNDLDLEDDERLCAVAFVKRFFARGSKDAIGRDLDVQSWPSTVSIAAVPWLRKIKDAEDKPELHAAAKDYAELVREESGARVSSARRLAGLDDFPESAGDFPWLSGNFLNHTALANERGTPLTDPGKERRALLVGKLRKLEVSSQDRAGNFYAMLLMDGDSMGRLIGMHGPEKVTPCLTRFASEVAGVVQNTTHSGICVYAGGDDLLAMLPLDRALDAVAAVRELYRRSFSEGGIGTATISAGLVFAHYRCVFGRVLKYAHQLLDGEAKDGAGRDAMAMGVLKPGGVACKWVGKFDHFVQEGGNCFTPLIRAYSSEVNSDGPGLSSSFLYNLRERFAELFDDAGRGEPEAGEKGGSAGLFDEKTMEALLVAEYLHGRRERKPEEAKRQLEEARKLMGCLLQVCRRADASHPEGGRFELDGARLVKFLALDGKEGAE